MTALRKILCLVLVMVLAMFCFAACKKNNNNDDQTNNDNGNEPTKTAWPEAGVYYFDDVNYENTLTLNVGDTFSLFVKGELMAGKYTLTDSELVLDFNAEGVDNVTATYEGNVISLTYQDATMRLLKKLNYTVSFNVDGGSAVAAQTVLNGKGATKPADPTRDGFVFVGWYAGADFKTAYTFGSPVTGDTTVYARWIAENVTGKEYTVVLNANYDGAALESVVTAGGKLFDLPTLTRDGFTFSGWWFSSDTKGEQLSHKYEDGMLINANTTLYALWVANASGSKLPEPVVNVTASNISWGAIDGARRYDVKVLAEDGSAVFEAETGSNIVNVSFDSFAAGKYQIVVTAKAQSGDQNNSTAVRYYVNKGLAKVSEFNVVGSTLVFNTVENAEKYLVTVVCGNAEHNHTAFDNGSSRTYDFSNCTMTAGGIKFTVTAVADGYASSTSDVFTFVRTLDSVTGFRLDEATQTLVWNEVASAEGYMVSVKCGNSAHNHDFINFGTQTFVKLDACDALEGGIVVKVYPKTEGYNSPAASEFVYNKTTLGTPANLVLTGNVLGWDAVAGATKYEVKVNGTAHEAATNSFDLTEFVDVVEGLDYTLTVRALSDTSSSLASTELVARYYEMNEKVSYANGKLTWTPVIGAQYYEIQVNDGEILKVEGGAFSASVALNKKGENLVKVRFVDGKNTSEWATTSVTAHRVVFDTLGGTSVADQFKAVGDPMELLATEKAGYDFVAWYNVPGGAGSNGAAYNDAFFAESGDIVLYAYYSAKKYEITYNYGVGGTGDLTSDFVSFDGHYQLTVPTASNVAGAFGGWYSAPYGMGVQYTDESGKSLAPWTLTEGKELYAFWIDETLEFTLTKVNGKDAYAVSKGARIALVTELTIPETFRGLPVAFIAANGFENCSNLKVINLPETIEQISLITPFARCSSLAEINVYDVDGVAAPAFTSEDGVLLDIGTGKTKLALVPMAKTGTFRIPAGVTEIPEAAFANSSISKVVISSEVTTIGREAFRDSTNLSSVVFEVDANGASAPLTIGIRAFMNCTKLEKITLPARLSDIKLQRYTVTDGIVDTTTGDNAFFGCTALKSINVSANNQNYKAIDSVLYSKDGRTLLFVPASIEGTFVVPEGTRSIAKGAFVSCSFIKEVVLPGSLTLVEEYAFYGLDFLEKLTFNGGGLSDLDVMKYAFANNKNLKTVELLEGSRLKELGEGAFMGCEDLESFVFPASMSKVGVSAFAGCSSLESVSFTESARSLEFGENAFQNCVSLTTVDLPANVTKVPGVFAGCSSLEAVNVADGSAHLVSVEGVVYDINKTEIVFFPQGKTGDFELPATVTTITNGVFQNVNLGTLTIPAGVTVIGDYAFNSASVDNIVFAGEATGDLTIGADAFNNADLGTLTLPANTVSIGDRAFYETSADAVVLNEGITSLGDYAFWGAELSVTVPASVKTIGAYCFGGYSEYSYDIWAYVYAYPNVTLTVENSQLETIGERAFVENPNVEDVVIPASVKTIGNYAFYECEELGNVTFAEGSQLKEIGAFAFAASSSYYASYYFTEITIPASVESIGAYAFSGTNLESVVFEDGDKDLVLGSTYVDHYYHEAMGTWYTDIYRGGVFSGCEELSEVVLPSRLTTLEYRTFYEAGYYTTLDLTISNIENSRLATIGDQCFYYSGISSFVVPKSVRNLPAYTDTASGETYDRLGIGAQAFYGTSKLTSITFEQGGDQPLTIGASAFYYISKLTAIELPARLATYTSYTGDVIAPLANGATVFASCETLTSITAEAGGYYTSLNGVLMTADMKEVVCCPVAFSGEFTVPASVTKIHDNAFYSVKGLTAITFEGGSENMTIGASAFKRCSNLTTIVLPDNVVSLGDETFYNCTGLQSLTLSAGLEYFAPTMISGCSALAEIKVGADGQGMNYSTVNGVLYSADKTSLITYPRAKADTELVVDANVKVIFAKAFMENNNIQKVVLPAGLVEIQDQAFYLCYGLTEINIPSTVQLIGKNAFGSCRALNSVTFEQGGDDLLIMNDYAFAYTYQLTDLELPARLYTIANHTFNQSGITNLTFAENSSLVSIGSYAFSGSNLVKLDVPAGVVSVGEFAFYQCANLLEVNFSEGLITVGDHAFAGSEKLLSVSFPASLKTLGTSVFYYYEYDQIACSSLESVTFAPGSQLQSIPAGTFAYTALKSIVIPASVTVIEGVDSTGEKNPSAFYELETLEVVEFENGSKCAEIGDYTFDGCSNLKQIELPNSVSTIGTYAFRYCSSLESIVIPETTTNLGKGAFWQCTSLSEVDFRSKTTELTEDLFYGCTSLTSFEIPMNVSVIAPDAFSGSGLNEFTVDPRNTFFKAIDGILYTADGTGIVAVPANKVIGDFVVPNTVTTIGEKLFYENNTITSLTFEGGRTEYISVGRMAFAECYSLGKVVFTEKISYVDEEAFYYCTSLTSVEIASDMTESMFGYDCFYNCNILEIKNLSSMDLEPGDYKCEGLTDNALRIYTEGESAVSIVGDFTLLTVDGEVYLVSYTGSETDVVVPEGVTVLYSYVFGEGVNVEKVTLASTVKEIMDGAFYYSNVKTVVANEGLENIGYDAFYYSDLQSINLPSTLVEIEQEAFYGCDLSGIIAIPTSVTTIGSQAFRGTGDITFLVSAASKPDGWHDKWSRKNYSSDHTILWGFTGEDITYNFETNGGSAVDSITSGEPITLPAAPTRDGFVFMGWYDNAEFDGDAITGSYYNDTKTTLYAKWMSEAEYTELFRGATLDLPFEGVSGQSFEGKVSEGGGKVYVAITVQAGETWNISTADDGNDHVIYLYDTNKNIVSIGSWYDYYDSGYEESYNYTFTEAGTYYFAAAFYSTSKTGTITVTVTQK